jgi:hypothetical protein
MYHTIDRFGFRNAFEIMRPNQFSYHALDALFDHLEQWEEDTGEEIELDVIAICCDYCEYDSIRDAAEAYGISVTDRQDDPLDDEALVERIRDHTDVILVPGSDHVVIRNY